jgi:pheromone shutdown protein TraB
MKKLKLRLESFHLRTNDMKILIVAWTFTLLVTSNVVCRIQQRPRKERLTPWFAPSLSRKVLIKLYRGGDVSVAASQTKQMIQRESEIYVENVRHKAAVTENAANSTRSNLTQQHTPSSWRKEMPAIFQRKGSKTFQKLQLGSLCEIYLLGTAHVSKNSSNEVQQLLEYLNPNCIFIELCDERVQLLEQQPTSDINNNKSNINPVTTKLSFGDRVKNTREAQGGSLLQAISTVLLTSIQEDFASELSVEVGGEFKCAHQYWQNRRDSPNVSIVRKPFLVLGDRPFHITIIRAWESLWWWPKLKLFVGLLIASLRKPKNYEIKRWLDSVMEDGSDVLTESFQDLRKQFPTLYRTIVEERDAWLAAKLVQTCRALTVSNIGLGSSSFDRIVVVAIVGAGHVPGICRYLTQNTNSSETPEAVLSQLVVTRKWSNNDHVQNDIIPRWINDVVQLH